MLIDGPGAVLTLLSIRSFESGVSYMIVFCCPAAATRRGGQDASVGRWPATV